MSDAATISVLMPVYNAQQYVAAAAESILAQTFRDFEFQIIDDGSTDGSLAILKQLAARDSRIRLISRPNTGYVAALNEMLASARGEFIARMDADDLSLPERFEKQVAALRTSPEIGVIGGQMELMDPAGRTLCIRHVPLEHTQIDGEHLNGIGGMIAHPAAMLRTEIIRAAGDYRLDFWPAEDLDLFLRLAERTRLANLPEVVLRYRLHEKSTSHQNRRRQAEVTRRSVAEARERRGLGPASDRIARDPKNNECRSKTYRMWAWCALEGGNVALAREYAWRAFWRRPFSYPSWRLAFRSAAGSKK